MLIRLQYLRTQLQGWRRAPGFNERGRSEEVLQGLRGLHTAARAVGLAAYERMCQGVVESLHPLQAGRGMPAHVLGRLIEWLVASQRHVRHPGERCARLQLQTHSERMAAEVQRACR